MPSCVTWWGMSGERDLVVAVRAVIGPHEDACDPHFRLTLSRLSDLRKHAHALGALARRWKGVQRTAVRGSSSFVCSAGSA